MEQLLYLECSAGISGDMVVAALLDAGASEQKLREVLDSLDIPGFKVEITRVKKSGLDVCDFNVMLDSVHDGHDHDMEYLYGREHENVEGGCGQEQEHDCDFDPHANHGDMREHTALPEQHAQHEHHGHLERHEHRKHYEHRNLSDIYRIIDESAATPEAKNIAKRVFALLADAEAKAHGTTREEVHFHEVGAIDSIVDILAAAVCLDDLSPQGVVISRLCEGRGMVRCQHGVIPVPVPAVVNIATACNLPLSIIDAQGELVTPTGAAFAAAVRTSAALPAEFTITRVGIGAGKRVYPETSGVLRAFLIAPVAAPATLAAAVAYVAAPAAASVAAGGARVEDTAVDARICQNGC